MTEVCEQAAITASFLLLILHTVCEDLLTVRGDTRMSHL